MGRYPNRRLFEFKQSNRHANGWKLALLAWEHAQFSQFTLLRPHVMKSAKGARRNSDELKTPLKTRREEMPGKMRGGARHDT